jgi:serine/threonine protein phosphatase PrpC
LGHDNEDALGVFEWQANVGVLAIADGLGGLPGGAEASRRMIESLSSSSSAEGVDPVIPCLESVNEDLIRDGNGSGTTVTVLFFRGREVFSYHVGDSTMLVVGRRGRIKLQTVPHSIVGTALANGQLDEKAAMRHPERHVIYNMIGMHDVWIETAKSIRLADLDTVILASDGLWDNLYCDEVVNLMRCQSLEKASQALVGTAIRRMGLDSMAEPGKPDDLSLILYRPRPIGS